MRAPLSGNRIISPNRQWTKTIHIGLGRPHYSRRVRRNFVAWWSCGAYKIAALPCIGFDPWLYPSPPSPPRQPSYSPYSRVSPSEVLDPLLVAPMEALETSFSWSAMLLVIWLVIYETIITTLALTHMTPPNDLSCHLERQWSWLFSNKNADVIRRIQDRHQCCGLHSV
jgi:hypothetical protein